MLCDSCESRDECVHIRNDGRPVTVEVTMTSLRNGGKPPGIRFLLIHDVTERKQLDAKLAVSEIRYRRLFEAAHDGVLILDPDTRKIIDANPFMTTLLEYGKEQLIGKELFEIGLLKDEAASKEMFRHLQSLQEVRYENLPLKTRNGRHQDVEVVANLYDEGGHPMIQCNIRDITERRRGEEHVKLLMAEVNHRARNLLALVQAFAHQTAKHGDPTTFMTRLSNRLDGLAAGQDLMVRSQSQGVELADLVEVQVAHFKDLIGTRLLITGPRHMMLNMAAAQGIGMAVHELGTNAAKYGALSNQDGRVVITWKITSSAEPMFSMSWLEEDGPRVVPPTRKGFGQAVIGRMAEASVDGHVELLYPKSGLTWTLSAPAKNVFMPTDPNNLMRRHDDA